MNPERPGRREPLPRASFRYCLPATARCVAEKWEKASGGVSPRWRPDSNRPARERGHGCAHPAGRLIQLTSDGHVDVPAHAEGAGVLLAAQIVPCSNARWPICGKWIHSDPGQRTLRRELNQRHCAAVKRRISALLPSLRIICREIGNSIVRFAVIERICTHLIVRIDRVIGAYRTERKPGDRRTHSCRQGCGRKSRTRRSCSINRIQSAVVSRRGNKPGNNILMMDGGSRAVVHR